MVTATRSKPSLKARAPEEVKPGRIKGILFGESGAGKTWQALSFPSPYYCDTEGGAKRSHYMDRLKLAGGAYFGPDDGACDFDALIEQIQALATEKHDHKTLVIDSITKVYQSKIASEAERLGDKDAFGASKKPAIAYMRRLVNWIGKLDMNVWFLAHETAKWAGEGKDRQQAGVTADVWDKLIYELDLTLRVEKHNKGFRTATVTKSRLESFPDGDRFPLQENGQDVGYAQFLTRYSREAIEQSATPIVLATEEQVRELVQLLEVLKVSPEEVEKWLEKAKADSWNEVTTEQASKAILWLRGKIR